MLPCSEAYPVPAVDLAAFTGLGRRLQTALSAIEMKLEELPTALGDHDPPILECGRLAAVDKAKLGDLLDKLSPGNGIREVSPKGVLSLKGSFAQRRWVSAASQLVVLAGARDKVGYLHPQMQLTVIQNKHLTRLSVYVHSSRALEQQ